MKRETITRELLASALRYLRNSRGLTQRDVAKRAAVYRDQGFGRLLESQISDFERGRALPSLESLLNFLAACSESGTKVDMAAFQKAIETVGSNEGEPSSQPSAAALDGAVEIAGKLVSELSERMTDRIRGERQGEMQGHRDEMAELRGRVVRTERLLGSLEDTEGV